MSALSDLLARYSRLDERSVEHLQRLAAQWQMLSDLSFADILLWVPIADGAFLCAAQCRPTTATTVYEHDLVGARLAGPRSAGLRTAYIEQRIYRESGADLAADMPVRRESIPVRLGGPDGPVIAVVGRDSGLITGRGPSQLELSYVQCAAELAAMIADGSFPPPPAPGDEDDFEGAGPRVGDGMLRIDEDGTVLYASPNALSVYRRLGLTGNLIDADLAAVTQRLVRDPMEGRESAERLSAGFRDGTPLSLEIEGSAGFMQIRSLPLRPHGHPLGALVLVQDTTELRRRDRQIMSKDATIREIHHRVKNNLQTVAALLRMQSRRVSVPEARHALEESTRRVSSIALMHETLSSSAIDDEVGFDAVVDRVLAMLGDVAGAGSRVAVRRSGSFGDIPADLATPMIMVLTELVQNAIEHGFDGEADTGAVTVVGERSSGWLRVAVIDDGKGLPPNFRIAASDRLGLQIVRTLMDAELHSALVLRDRADGRRGSEATFSGALRSR
jgi:two-component sensor histidine kinase